MGSKGISIIIPTKNSGDSLESLLKSVNLSNRLEIIVVDSHSSDRTVEVARKYNCKILDISGNRSRARNIGALESKFDILLFLDSDMIIEKETITECIDKIEFCDAIIFRELTIGSSILAKERRFQRIGYFHSLYLESPRCFRKDVFIALGGYDENMEGFEDLELTSRIVGKGYKIEWADSWIKHNESVLTILDYIDKRNFYFSYRENFRKKNNKYYSKVFSIETRVTATFNSVKQYGLLRSMLLLPGLFLLLVVDTGLVFLRV